MGKTRSGMTMSLDGFVADRSGDVGSLYPDFAALRHSEALQEVVASTTLPRASSAKWFISHAFCMRRPWPPGVRFIQDSARRGAVRSVVGLSAA